MKSQVLRAFSITVLLSFLTLHVQSQVMTFAQAVAPVPFLPNSAIIPVPGSSLHYTHVMFDHPPMKGAATYKLTITETSGDSPWKAIDVIDTGCASLVKDLTFGKSYKWIYSALTKKGKVLFTSPEYTFTVLPLPEGKRVRVERSTHEKGFISFDAQGLIVDWSGKPIWFLPAQFSAQSARGGSVSDMNVSSAGTITFVSQQNAFEITPDGRVAWQSPGTGTHTVGDIHDCIHRMPNGHILTLGTHTVPMSVPFQNVTSPVEFGVIAQYDRKGTIVWKWDSYTYVRPAEIEFKKLSASAWYFSPGLVAIEYANENGVDYVYAGFRDLNRIVKMEMATSKVVAVYGRQMDGGYGWKDDKLFALQNDFAALSNGNIAVFNNDSVSLPGVISSVKIIAPGKSGGAASTIWSFACNYDKSTNGKITKGGSIDELPDNNLLVNFGEQGRCIEIAADSKVMWDAFAETKSPGENSWTTTPQNHVNYVPCLYPVWFTTQMISNGKKSTTISIRNEGEAADTYSVEYFVKDKWLTLAAITLQPEKQTNCVIPKVEKAPFSKIRVVSAHNADFVRTIDVIK